MHPLSLNWGHCTRDFPPRSRGLRSFSLVELLVVVGIIALLAGLLLVALKSVQESGRRTQTLATMQSFLRACEAFRIEHGMNPGVIPEEVLAQHNHDISHGVDGLAIGGTENALLHLMGGYRVLPPGTSDDSIEGKQYLAFVALPETNEIDIGTDGWKLAVNLQRLGEGPWINGKVYPPYFTPRADEVAVLDGDIDSGATIVQWPWSSGSALQGSSFHLPDLADAWGNPIVYLRQARTLGALVAAPELEFGQHAQFRMECAWPYFLGKNQFWACDNEPSHDPNGPQHIPAHGSVFYGSFHVAGQESWNVDKAMAMIIRHQSLEGGQDPGATEVKGVARSAILLISAGADGIYFSAVDGPGSIQRPIGCSDFPYEEFVNGGAAAMDDFDDLVAYGSSH